MYNTAVITTKFVVDENSPVLSVFKDDEDDWQFLGNEKSLLICIDRIYNYGAIFEKTTLLRPPCVLQAAPPVVLYPR